MPKQAKPDFPDVDKDGDRKEPITKAVKDLQSKKAMIYHDKPKMMGYGDRKKPKMDHK